MKVRVIKEFRDKTDFALIREEGQVLEVEEERAQALFAFGVATPLNEQKQQDKEVEKAPEQPQAKQTKARAKK